MQKDILTGEALAFTPIFEDEAILAFSKPEGIHTLPLKGEEGDDLYSCIVDTYPFLREIKGFQIQEGGVLHRLDKDTSGLVLFAKTQSAFDFLKAEQDADRIIKTYEALCDAFPYYELSGARPLCSSPKNITYADWAGFLHADEALSASILKKLPLKITSQFRSYGKNGFKVAPVLSSDLTQKKTSERASDTIVISIAPKSNEKIENSEASVLTSSFLVTCTISRGFRHQIRSHLAWVSLPIQGDVLYYPEDSFAKKDFKRMCLHARKIAFTHPLTKEQVVLEDASSFLTNY